MVLDFNPVNDCPLWLAMLNDAMDKSQVNLYNQWLWLTPDDILALQYCPKLSKQKKFLSPGGTIPMSQGSRQCTLNFNIPLAGQTLTFSRLLMTSTWHSPGNTWPARSLRTRCLAPNSYASSTDQVTLFMKSIKQEPKDFPVIKSLNQRDSVKCAVNATPTIQLIAEVLNHTYIPSAEGKHKTKTF
jgi:hypothetical protein